MLPKWFCAIWIDANQSKGISSVQLAKLISVTQKTAWFMLQRIRQCAGQLTQGLAGTIEIDETYLGGRKKNMHFNRKKQKPKKGVVFGMRERGEYYRGADRE